MLGLTLSRVAIIALRLFKIDSSGLVMEMVIQMRVEYGNSWKIEDIIVK